MQILPSANQFLKNPASASLLDFFRGNELQLELGTALLYYSFPLYRDEEGGVILADSVLISRYHGVITFALSDAAEQFTEAEAERCAEITEQVPPYVQSRLIKNRHLREKPTKLSFEITPLVFAPFLNADAFVMDTPVLRSTAALSSALENLRGGEIPPSVFDELVATIEGAKGLIRPKKRTLSSQDEGSKGKQAEFVEAAITLFDQQQKHGMMGRLTGPQRVRGLAGSGKTVVLAMKAAQMHLQYPDARIAYTFWTKSLYQHVKRLITRFYRQFDDRDPEWEKHVHVLHGWGSHSTPGLYSVACEQHGLAPLSYQQAAAQAAGDRFDFACKSLVESAHLKPIYDYIMVDEGQDFPLSFIRLCHQLSEDGKFVLAYDDLQTIFQATTPTAAEIFGTNADGVPTANFEEDVVLYKCYRNPREVVVTAHALGFGIYGDRIVQMLESPDHWSDIGYVVREGEFVAGSQIRIERPRENSLTMISDRSTFDQIVQARSEETIEHEVAAVVAQIEADLADGLEPDDVLVVCVDDRHAKKYLSEVERALREHEILSNNLHNDSFGIRDFTREGRVTLATVHKAKGNEALMVYVVGVDSVMFRPDVRKRNMLFTAMTRAKGWVRVSGVGQGAMRCQQEIAHAREQFPYLTFSYPGPEELKVMRRDLAAVADKRLRARRLMEQLQDEFTAEEINEMIRELPRTSRKASRRK